MTIKANLSVENELSSRPERSGVEGSVVRPGLLSKIAWLPVLWFLITLATQAAAMRAGIEAVGEGRTRMPIECIFPGVEAVVWWGFLVPAHTPPDVIARLNKDIDGALHDGRVKDTLHDMGAVIKGGSPDDFKNFIASETVKWTKIIKGANIKGE